MGKFLANKGWLYIIIAGLVFWIFLLQDCNGEKTKRDIEVTVPEKEGSFKSDEKDIDYVPVLDSTEIAYKDKIVKVPNRINDSLEDQNKLLIERYKKLSDSLTEKEAELERFKWFLDAIQIREFNQKYEDSFVDITASGKVQGKLKSLDIRYRRKKVKVSKTIEEKEVKFRLLAGGGIGNNTMFNDFMYKLNLGFQNKSGSIYRIGYSNMNKNDYIWLEYDMEVFKIKN